ncbi:MAG: DsbA family protein [Gammaproteobacteria bacterium]|nr:DsbA family protein [Gammaproteobacteria bacterium]
MTTIDYFSDVLCVWAYSGQIRLDELERQFGDQVFVRQRFVALFGDTGTRIGRDWEDGGFDGFGRHIRTVCEQWDHAHPHADVWTRCRPLTSTTAHVFLKAVGLCLGVDDEAGAAPRRGAYDRLVSDVRVAFFEQARDISRLPVLYELLPRVGISSGEVSAQIESGAAYAALHRDAELMKAYGVQGSPTYVFNEGRQLLYGNVGYRIVESNVRELLDKGAVEGAPSWC